MKMMTRITTRFFNDSGKKEYTKEGLLQIIAERLMNTEWNHHEVTVRAEDVKTGLACSILVNGHRFYLHSGYIRDLTDKPKKGKKTCKKKSPGTS